MRLLALSSLSLGFAFSPLLSFAEDRANAITPLLQPYVDRHALAGAVTVTVSKDKLLDVSTAGYADIAAKTPMPANAMFWIASQSKPTTATAVMMLVDEGKIRVEDAVETCLPEFRGQMMVAEKDDAHALLKKPSRPISIADVLSHTSGLPFRSPVEEPTLDALPLATAVKSYAMLPLQWEPGSKYEYSNAGINTAARVVEVVADMPYEKFMQERIFDPLGMKDTTFWANAEQVGRLATLYKPNGEKNRSRSHDSWPALLSSLGSRVSLSHARRGLFSTASDVSKFCQMILNGGELGGVVTFRLKRCRK